MSTNLAVGILQGLTAAQLANMILAPNVIGVTSDTNIGKQGDGVTIFSSLTAINWAGGVSGAWGSITGTLSNQTDLQSALDLKGNITSQTFVTPNVGVAAATSLTATGLIKSSGTAGIGYATGAGGTVTQATDKTTGVTLSKTCGAITLNNASLADAAIVSFTVTNTLVAANDAVIVNHSSAGTAGAYQVWANAIGAGSYKISVRNVSGGALGEAIVITAVLIKAVAA